MYNLLHCQAEIVTAIQEMMEARAEDPGSSEDVIELQLKKAQEEIAALQDDKDQLSQVNLQINIVDSFCIFPTSFMQIVLHFT